MASLTELAEFVDQVLRLDTDMPVKGFDGFTIGTANEQAQVLANRTLWLKENIEHLAQLIAALTDRNVVLSVNKKTGAVTLSYKDVGAAAESHKHSADDITPTSDRSFVTAAEKRAWNDKQNALVSGNNIKTLNSKSLLGVGNIEIAAKDIVTDDSFQFLSAAERKTWNAKQNTLVSGKDIATLHGHSLLGGGDTTLTAAEVGADPKGTAEQEVDTHEQKDDPHPQYLTTERGNGLYVEEAGANKPNGYLKLDDKGQIPANLAELFEVRYLIVGNAEERLAIKGSNNVTICLQTDKNRIYYLDGGDDPSVEDNWHSGRDADPSAVISVFGRSGVINASNGDYTADQITETDTRVFVTPEQKTAWAAKQDKLVSGKNIRSINGISLLGSTNIEVTYETLGAAPRAHEHNVEDINTSSEKQFVSENDKARWDAKQVALENGKNIKTINGEGILGDGNIDINPSEIGAAEKVHQHVPEDITTNDDAQFVSVEEKTAWNAKQDKLVSGENIATVFGNDLLAKSDIGLTDIEGLPEAVGDLFLAGSGISVGYDEAKDKVVITNTSQGGTTGSKITVIFVDEGKKDTGYKYVIGNKMSFDFSAYALKEKIIGEAKSTDYAYNDSVVKVLPQNALPRADKHNDVLIADTETLAVTTVESNAWGSYYLSDDIDAASLDGIGLSVPSEVNTMIIPEFSGKDGDDDTKSVDGYMPLTSKIYPYFQAWKAFQAPVTDPDELDNISPHNYWSDLYYLNSTKEETYLGIASKKKERVTGYAFQLSKKYNYTTSTQITDWVFQGRNYSDEPWKDIETQNGQSLVGRGEWKKYLLSEGVEYSQYRILVKGTVNPKSARASIVRFQLLSDPSMLIKGNDGVFYTLTDNVLTQVGDIHPTDFAEKGFKTTDGRIDASLLKDISPFKILTGIESKVNVDRYGASSQIVIHTTLEKTDFWYSLKNLSATVKDTGDAERIFAMFSVDGKNWFYFKDNNWKRFGELTNDTASADNVIANGNTLSELATITKEQWIVLLNSITNNATLGIAYASKIKNLSDARVPNKVTANFDKLSNWVLTDKAEVGIELTSREIVFTPTVDGAYRFCYKFN